MTKKYVVTREQRTVVTISLLARNIWTNTGRFLDSIVPSLFSLVNIKLGRKS